MLITSYQGVFAEKLQKQKEDLKKELKKAKSERRKEWLRNQLKQTKKLRDTLKQIDEQNGQSQTCPHCGKDI